MPSAPPTRWCATSPFTANLRSSSPARTPGWSPGSRPAALGLPLHLNGGGHQIRDLVHVDDIAEGTLRALTASEAHRQTLNIGTGTPTAIREVARLVASHYPGTHFHETPMPPGDPLGGYASTARMETLLHWRPAIDITTGTARYVTWLERTPQAIPGWLRTAADA